MKPFSPLKTSVWILAALVVVILFQLYIPIDMIRMQEVILQKGTIHKLRTAPVDPYDAFRGRYVTLDFVIERSLLPSEYIYGEKINNSKNGYVLLSQGSDGFSTVTAFSWQKPQEQQEHWLEVGSVSIVDAKKQEQVLNAIERAQDNSATNSIKPKDLLPEVFFDVSFDRYYMNEKLAKEAEQLYNQFTRTASDSERQAQKSYAEIRLYKQQALIDKLYINGVEVHELVKQELEKKATQK